MREERAQMNVKAVTKAAVIDFQFEHKLKSQDAALKFLLDHQQDGRKGGC